MHRVIYVSRSLIGTNFAEVGAIVERSIAWNAAHDVTGMLWFDGNYFAQALEGDATSVHALMEDIGRDHRHKDIQVVLDRPILTRMFGGWAMMRADDTDACSNHAAFMLGFSRAGEGLGMKRLYEVVIAAEQFGA